MHSQHRGKLLTGAAQSARNPHMLGTITPFLEHGSPERLINFPKDAQLSGGRAGARTSAWVTPQSLVSRIV